MSTIADVAREASVSISTVSRVMNDKHTGDPEVRERVVKAAEGLQYHPSSAARALAGRVVGAGMSMSFIMRSFVRLGTYYGDILHGAEEEARRRGFQLYFSTAYHNMGVMASHSIPKGISGEEVKGIIYGGDMPEDFLNEVKRAGLTAIHINSHPDEPVNSVMCDNLPASHRAVTHLIEKGHRRIGCIAHRPGTRSTAERLAGYRLALVDAGIEVDQDLVARGGLEPEDGRTAMEQLLKLMDRPTAIFGVVDEVAIGAMQLAKEKGLKVPDDMSFVGVNDLPMSTVCDPPLTTVRILRGDMGKAAVQRLFEVVRNPNDPPRRIDVLCEFVERGSVAVRKVPDQA